MIKKNGGIGVKNADTRAPFARTEAQAQAALDKILREKAEDEQNNLTWHDVDTPRARELTKATATQQMPPRSRVNQ